jgi:hypothetical protein
MEPFDIKDSLILSKGELNKSKNDEAPSHDMGQQVPLEKLGRIPEDRIQAGRTSNRQNKATITESNNFFMAEVISDRPNMGLDQLSNQSANKNDEANSPFKIYQRKLRGLNENN